jgi:hypothetical protein
MEVLYPRCCGEVWPRLLFLRHNQEVGPRPCAFCKGGYGAAEGVQVKA